MFGLNLIGPKDNTSSKCWQVLLPLQHGWPGSIVSHSAQIFDRPLCFWGFSHDNISIANRCRQEKHKWLFADMPYFNRWMGEHTANSCHWRLIPNGIHETTIGDYPSDRVDLLDIKLKDWRNNGSHILICPSSDTVTRWVDKNLNENSWVKETIHNIKQHSDRPIRVRRKPRNGKSSGPMVESVPLEDDLRNCWAVVTSCSIVGAQAAIAGIPVFCHAFSPAAAIGNFDLADIEKPRMPERQAWLNTLSYRQFTKAELGNGFAKEILHQLL